MDNNTAARPAPNHAIMTHPLTRRSQILDAAVAVARDTEYDRVRMRDVAGRAGVAVGTVYQHFPSKVHLLVNALGRELNRLAHAEIADLADVEDSYARLRMAVFRLVDGASLPSQVTEAFIRAYSAAQVVAVMDADEIRAQTIDMLAQLMNGGRPETDFHHVAELVTDVWTAEWLALSQHRRTQVEVRAQLAVVIDRAAKGAGAST